jgi:hypothetical protein
LQVGILLVKLDAPRGEELQVSRVDPGGAGQPAGNVAEGSRVGRVNGGVGS